MIQIRAWLGFRVLRFRVSKLGFRVSGFVSFVSLVRDLPLGS